MHRATPAPPTFVDRFTAYPGRQRAAMAPPAVDGRIRTRENRSDYSVSGSRVAWILQHARDMSDFKVNHPVNKPGTAAGASKVSQIGNMLAGQGSGPAGRGFYSHPLSSIRVIWIQLTV